MSGRVAIRTAVVFAPMTEQLFRLPCPSGNNLVVLRDRIGGLRVQVAGIATSATADDVE